MLYRRPNIAGIDRWLQETRAASMGTLIATSLDAPMKIAEALERGAHVGMLVDQYYVRGVPVTFFGRSTRANPLLARLAQHFDCPIHGVRVVRLPGNRYRPELTDAITPVRDARGQDRHRRHDAGHHERRRRLDPRAPGAMALAAPPLASGRRRQARTGWSRGLTGRSGDATKAIRQLIFCVFPRESDRYLVAF